MMRTPLATAEMRFAPHPLGALVRMDSVFDSDAIGTDAVGLRNFLARYVTDPVLARRYFGVDSPIEKITHVLPPEMLAGGSGPGEGDRGEAPLMPLPVPLAAAARGDARPTVQAVRLVEPTASSGADFIVCCTTEMHTVSVLAADPTVFPNRRFAEDLPDLLLRAEVERDGARDPISFADAVAAAAPTSPPLELRALRSHGVVRCHTIFRVGDHFEAGECCGGRTTPRVPGFSCKQSFYVWDDDEGPAEADGKARRLVRFTMVGLVPRGFQRAKRRRPSSG